MFTKEDFLGGLSMYNASLMMVIDAGGSAALEEALIREQNDVDLLSAVNDEVNARKEADGEIKAKLAEIDDSAVADLREDIDSLHDGMSVLEAGIVDAGNAVTKAKLELQATDRELKDALDEQIILRENSLIDTQEQIDGLASEVHVLSTVASTVDGAFWLDVSGDKPAIKILYGGTSYACPLENLTDDPVTQAEIDALVKR